MRVLVTGASSFLGAHFCRLARHEHEVLALWRNTSLVMSGVRSIRCDLASPTAVALLASERPDAVVHLAYRIKGGAAAMVANGRMLDAVLALDIPVVYASSTVVHWPDHSAYRQARMEEEARVQAHPQPFAILRPCAPFGPRLKSHRPHHKESFHTLADLVARSPVVPVVGGGQYLRQPIFAEDFAQAIVHLLRGGLPRRAFDAGGATALSFNAIIDTLAAAMGRRVRKIHLPKALFGAAASLSWGFDPELITTLDVDDVADPSPLAEAVGFWPRSFQSAVGSLIPTR